MKYTLNDGYNGESLVSQDGLIFKKDLATEVPEAKSFEVEMYIKQKFIIPFREEIIKLKDEIKVKEETISEITKDDKMPIPEGVSTVEKEEDTFKPVVQDETENVKTEVVGKDEESEESSDKEAPNTFP